MKSVREDPPAGSEILHGDLACVFLVDGRQVIEAYAVEFHLEQLVHWQLAARIGEAHDDSIDAARTDDRRDVLDRADDPWVDQRRADHRGIGIDEPDDLDAEQVVPAFLTIIAANTVVSLASHPMKQRLPGPDEVERITHLMMEMGRRVSAAEYVRATQTMHRLGRQMAAFHEEWDVLLTPALGTLPPPIGWIDMMMEDVDEYWRRVFAFSATSDPDTA